MPINKRIVVCGGHLSPALAVLEQLKINPHIKCFYIGRKYTFENDRAISLEYKTITSLEIPFFSLTTARLSRILTAKAVISLVKFPVGLCQSLWYLLVLRPHAVVSFGGYIALPVAISAWALGIPVITHEQTHVFGLSNRLIAHTAKYILLSWKDTKGAPTGSRVTVTGLPLRNSLFSQKFTSKFKFGDKKLPLLFITGGSSGASTINKSMIPIIAYLVKHFRVLHQTGNAYQNRDYQLLMRERLKFSQKYQQNYRVVTHIPPEYMGSILSLASLVVGRAGANTVSELEAFQIKSILIPLAFSGGDEQMKNAKYLADKGLATVIPQSSLTSQKLLYAIRTVSHKGLIPVRKKHIRYGRDNGTYKLIEIILNTLK